MADELICLVRECSNQRHVRGLCVAHYKKWYRATHPVPERGTPKIDPNPGDVSKFIRDVAIPCRSEKCLFWPFSLSHGYAAVKNKSVSRLVCEAVHGAPPSKRHEAAHSCGMGNRGCVNPTHLSWKTKKQNQRDRFEHGTDSSGERNAFAKLTEQQARAILLLTKHEFKVSDIARWFSVSPNTILGIKNRDTWKHIS